jgi:MoaA/NifB/PqqE/SkfB family radical SAM enzyme
MELSQLWKKTAPDALAFMLSKDPVRKIILRKAEEKIYKSFVQENREHRPLDVQEGRYLMLKNLLNSINRLIAENKVSAAVSRSIIRCFVGKVLLGEEERTEHFVKQFGTAPPAFLAISPTTQCNLSCKGCYAPVSSDNCQKLSFSTLTRILDEKKRLWGSYFTVLTGGEPLLYEDGRKTILDLAEENDDQYFLISTNGMTITREVARRMARLGNVTPAISVEGFERETDERRGKGVFRMILQAMENLRKAGVPFGINATATRRNVDSIIKDKFADFYFREMGAVYGWIFQYMPIGRGYSVDLMITPEQRLALYRKEQKMIAESHVFLVDFWNCGPYSRGCISAGRPGGYAYIDGNGNIAPCVFYRYSASNINDMYRDNKTLNDVLFSPFLTSLRQWPDSTPPSAGKTDPLTVPCIIRDHFGEACDLVTRFNGRPLDEHAADALHNAGHRMRMTEYGKAVRALAAGAAGCR